MNLCREKGARTSASHVTRTGDGDSWARPAEARPGPARQSWPGAKEPGSPAKRRPADGAPNICPRVWPGRPLFCFITYKREIEN